MKLPLSACAFLCLVLFARASTWVLRNGDRVTGDLVSETDHSVMIQHPALGRLILERSALQPTSEAAARAAALAANQVKPARLSWKREIEFGFTQESGPTAQRNLSARVQLDAVDGDDTFRLTGRLSQAESGGMVSADERALDLRWRHQLDPRFFVQSLSTWSAAPVRSLDQSLEQQVGGGFRLTAPGNPATTANVGLGAAVRYQERVAVGAETSVLGTLFQDFTHVFSANLKLSEDANLGLASDRPYSPAAGIVGSPPVPADGGNYRVRFNTLLQGKVTKTVTFNLRYTFDYDRSVPDPNARLDRRLTTALGYAW